MKHRSLFCFLVALFSTSAFAAGAGGKTNLGFQLGVGMPGKVSPVVVFGFEGNLGLGDRLAVGPFYYKYGSSFTVDSDGSDAVDPAMLGTLTAVTSEVSTTFMGAQGSFALPNVMQGFAAGMRIGKGSTTTVMTATQGTSTLTLNEETSGIMIAPRVLLDKPVSASVSVGGELSYWFGLNSGMPRGLFIMFPVRYMF